MLSATRRLGFPTVLLLAGLWAASSATTPHADEGPGSKSYDFEIFDPATEKPIGHTHYVMEQSSDGFTIKGKSTYSDGKYDVEEEQLAAGRNGQLPALIEFHQSYFNAAGTMERKQRVDFRSGFASCTDYTSGKAQPATAEFKFPADTYTGASVMRLLRDYLKRTGGREAFKFHFFTCSPSPRVASVEVRTAHRKIQWQKYPAAPVVKVDVIPNLGFLNFGLRHFFVPKITTWFDPANGWTLVGAKFERYYNGPEILMVKSTKASESTASVTSK